MKTFTIQDSLNWYGLKRRIYSVGTVVRTTKQYSGGDDKSGPLTVVITKIEVRPAQLNEDLTSQGYTLEQVYRGKYTTADGAEHETVFWPDEIESVLFD